MRLRDRAGVAVRGRVERAGAHGVRAGGELRQARRLPDAHAHDGLVQAGRRGAAAHTARVRLERGRPDVLQQRRQLRAGPLAVLFHAVGRVHGAGPEARVHELQRQRDHRALQETAHRVVEQRTK